MIEKLVIGTRSSNLAITQTNIVLEKLKEISPSTKFTIKKIKTKGDILLDKDLNKILDKGFFVNEIQGELVNESVDIAVHSLKDLPSENNHHLESFTVTKRENPMDVLVLRKELKESKLKIIGTSSIRRKKQIQGIYKDVIVNNIRGNVETRLKKLDKCEYDGIILAAAGLKRLGLEERIYKHFDKDEMIPSAGQGAIAVECRKKDKTIISLLKRIQDDQTEICVKEERKFLKLVGGGCSSPDAVLCEVTGNNIEICGKIFNSEKNKYFTSKIVEPLKNHQNIGAKLANNLKIKSNEKEATNIILTNEGNIEGFEGLNKVGFSTHHFPMIKIKPLNFKISNVDDFDYLLFTSKNGVKNFFSKMEISDKTKFICLGQKTDSVLKSFGYKSSYVAKRNYAKYMAEELIENKLIFGKKVLLIQGKIAKDELLTNLKDFCKIKRLNVYNTEPLKHLNDDLAELIYQSQNYVVFTSPSAFDSFANLYSPKKIKIISIGKTTTKHIADSGFECLLTSKMQSYEGISESIIKHFKLK